MSSNPDVQVQRSAGRQGGYGRLIVVGVIGVLILIFILSNRGDVRLSFLWWDFTWPTWLLIIITLLIGFGTGWLTSALLRRRRRRERRRAAAA